MTTTLDRVRAIVSKTYKIDVEKLRPELPLSELGVDSLGLGLLLFDTEDEFKIKFVTEPAQLTTLGDVVDYIDAEIARQAVPARTQTSTGAVPPDP